MRGLVTYTSTSSPTWPGRMLTLSTYLHTKALRIGSEILLPFGNSRKRRTRDPALSTIYLVPTGRRFGRRVVKLTALAPEIKIAPVHHHPILCVRILTELELSTQC